jgi:thiamine pyrophosphate-dependent acetolactate synthase large subunit-like protein
LGAKTGKLSKNWQAKQELAKEVRPTMTAQPMIERRAAVRDLLADRQNLLVVAGLGSPVYDVYAAGDHALNFYNWGAMGSAVMIGLGLALARPTEPVVVFTGDGEMLMGIGALTTLAQHKPKNLSIVVLDNEQYAETGQQTTATGHGVDLAAIAASCGVTLAETLRHNHDIAQLRAGLHARGGTRFSVLKIAKGDVPRTVPIRDGAAIKVRFRAALLGAETQP